MKNEDNLEHGMFSKRKVDIEIKQKKEKLGKEWGEEEIMTLKLLSLIGRSSTSCPVNVGFLTKTLRQ